jgi:hypothetical protein
MATAATLLNNFHYVQRVGRTTLTRGGRRNMLAPDVTFVRSVLVPAAMKLLGYRNWYLPAWLERLPQITIEGEAKHAAAPDPADAESERSLVAVG